MARRIDFWNRCFVVGLLVSGVVHFLLFLGSNIAWEDPVSYRKPALFGLSTGLTLWSCDWCFRQLRQGRYSRAMRSMLGWSLFIEVGLITLQTWRSEASHFNQDGIVNSLIELSMLILITIAMFIIGSLTISGIAGNFLPHVSSSMRIAIRWGLAYLVLSGAIGFVITYVGHRQQLLSKPPESWGDRGILKFPHGVTIHAVQTLAIVAWLADRFFRRLGAGIVLAIARLHGVLLAIAIVHTFCGRGRFEFDPASVCIAVLGIGWSLVPIFKPINHVGFVEGAHES